MPAYQYVGDDGTTYQIEQSSLYSASTAGNLTPAVGSEPVFPALWVARHMVCIQQPQSNLPVVHLVCNPTNTGWLFGPGGSRTVGGAAYTIYKCIGEQRAQL